ncbi:MULTISPECIES: IS630 family transposase [Burkholderiaceae]|jgi:transposase|uniref:IS630 family transposase n=1 Tax=Paraburkholderia fungorum TaxID=134537 RepID=A0AAP1L3P7_9BURK|nr:MULTISPECIES: IS630 family transposase [Burkholderiaceae]MBB4518335.1 transposase [Paraburkholderia fungorum]MDT8843093.1 IS630 family transposase [Paraburkholderia fungorum]USX11156.1 IS630 family transposase [Paraburkholderia fungorum]
MRIAAKVELSEAQRRQLETWATGRTIPVRVAERAKMILLAAQGQTDKEIGAELGIWRGTVARWRARFIADGVARIQCDESRPGRKPKISARKVKTIVALTTQQRPDNATHWSTRSMAAVAGVSAASVRRIWQAHGLKPRRVESFKVSNDKHFAEKLEDIVGLYLDPPEHALVLCCDEKSQIQALDRTQPGLPLKRGRAQTMRHDYKRHGATTLFAAMNTLDGSVIGQCQTKHRHQEWLSFLRKIDRNTPKHKELHLIADNYATHKHPEVKAWLAKHPRFHMHFTPTSASWLNMVERFFRDLSENQLRRAVFRSVPELVGTIEQYVEKHNRHQKPFIWTAKASDILAKVTRARNKLNQMQSV